MQMGDFDAMSIMGLGFRNQTVQVVAAALADIFLTIVFKCGRQLLLSYVTFDHC